MINRYFELVAFAVNGEVAEEVFYLTDTVNMLQVLLALHYFTRSAVWIHIKSHFQGVWVFLTFVCKRNVLKVENFYFSSEATSLRLVSSHLGQVTWRKLVRKES